MKKNELEQTIRNAFLKLPHDGLTDDVFDACRPRGDVELTKPRRRPIRLIGAMTAVAASLALIACGAALLWQRTPTPSLTVSLDVNPSVEIKMNDQEQILAVTALNDDAQTVIGDKDYNEQPVEQTVRELVDAMVHNGYLSDLANSVLISVESEDTDKAATLQIRLSEEVEQALAADGLSGAVMSQTTTNDKELAALAKQYHISTGKAALITHICSLDPLKTFDELAPASINELNLLAQRLQAQIHSTGEASAKAYIPAQEAVRIAAEDVGADVQSLMFVETELDYERGKMCYEVEFVWEGIEYEYDLDATTGEILKAKQEDFDDTEYDVGELKNFADMPCADVSDVKAAVLADAGVSEADVTEYDIEWDTRKNLRVYEIEFEFGTTEYKYFVNAETGEILESKTEIDEDDDDRDEEIPVDGLLPQETVKQAVLADAGVSEADVTEYDCETDTKGGAAVYEVEFECGGTEYDYTVDAVSGEILRANQDAD